MFFVFLLQKKVHETGTSYIIYGERIKTEAGLYDPVVIYYKKHLWSNCQIPIEWYLYWRIRIYLYSLSKESYTLFGLSFSDMMIQLDMYESHEYLSKIYCI